MKTTRSKLVEFLNLNFPMGFEKEPGASFIADKLIESGLVEVEEEPKEWWLLPRINGVTQSKVVADNYPDSIHVHSVDQCKKYEKTWNQIKDDFRQFSSVTNRMEELEKGE